MVTVDENCLLLLGNAFAGEVFCFTAASSDSARGLTESGVDSVYANTARAGCQGDENSPLSFILGNRASSALKLRHLR